MENKILCFLILLLCLSCNGNKLNKANNQFQDRIYVSCSCDSIILDNVVNPTQVEFKFFDTDILRETISQSKKICVIDLLKNVKNPKEFALKLIDNKLVVPLQIVIGGTIDTTLFYSYTIKGLKNNSSTIKGNCATLVSKANNPKNEVNLRRWLYKQNKYLPDSAFVQFVRIVNDLSEADKNVYITNDKIPVLKNFFKTNYYVNTKIKADKYVLFAASSQQELDDFIEDIIANNFDLTTESVSIPMRCYRKLDSDGYKCIFLIAINKDWTTQIVPLGLVAIDNEAPMELFSVGNGASNLFSFSVEKEIPSFLSFIDIDNTIVCLPDNCEPIDGYCSVSIADCDGNEIACNVSFDIYFSGDISKVVIHRIGDLAEWNSKKNFTFNLENEKSPFQTNIKMHLCDGDNFIPITIYDKHGNYRKTKIKQTARFTRIPSNDINIDNNINVWGD